MEQLDKDETESIKQLQRALYYESQYRNAIVSDAVSFYDANITRDIIESDFFFRDEDGDFVSVPNYLGLQTPCKFSEFQKVWLDLMVPDRNQKTLATSSVLREKLIETYNQGKREFVVNYWAENLSGKKIFYNQRYLLTRNEFGDVCALSIIKDSTNLKEWDDEFIHSELEQYAYTDPITNGYNYNKFKEILRDNGRAGSIISLDIHSFKVINTICGVTKGDEVIKLIWRCIVTSIDEDKDELAAHINADHYVIFLPSVDEDSIVKRIKDLTLALLFVSVDLDIPQIQPYFGIARWNPGRKVEQAYNEAITAKHNAKYEQEVNYSFFDEKDTLRLLKEKEILNSFDEAIAKKEFQVWFQPKYKPKTRELVGAEALVRWIRKDGTFMAPDEFIPLFETNNMIRPLDEYIFKRVCQYQKKWQDEGKKIVPVSVNLSRASVYYKGIAEQYKRITELIDIDAKYIPIEITESAAISNEKVKNIAEKFHSSGFSLQIDDFGSGYSTLSSLNMMHFDTLKLDKSLIDFIGNYGGNRLIEHTISLAKELGIAITAEGVETEAQVRFLKQIGCDNIQGFFYSKPVKAEDYEILLEKKYSETVEDKVDLVEEHLYSFNSSYYKPALYTGVINFTRNTITDYTENHDWNQETHISARSYDEALEKFIENLLHPDYKDSFRIFMNRERLMSNYAGIEETKFFEYKRTVNGEMKRMRIMLNIFKVEDNDDLWCYIKIYILE